MAPPLDALIDDLRRYPLLTPDQADELPELRARFPEARALARELIRRGWLTAYQANQVFQGRAGDLVLGSYLLLDRLGAGGMGEVYRARHRAMDREVALKVIYKDRLAGPTAWERFRREVRAAARLSHPNIVVAHDAEEVGNVHFLAMEYVAGTDLDRLVQQSGPLPVARACEYARQAALGLQHAHERGVIHRDIKPGNLLVSRPSPNGPEVVKILDFGLARLENEAGRPGRVTQLGRLVGTVDFVAPEQVEDPRAADVRADVYGLGCTLFYLLTGRPPFPDGDRLGRLTARLTEEAPPARPLRPDVPEALDAVLARLLARDPARRYQTAAAAAAALEPFTRPPEAAPAELAFAASPPRRSAPARKAKAGLRAGPPDPKPSGDSDLALLTVPRDAPARPRAAAKPSSWPVLAGVAFGAAVGIGFLLFLLFSRPTVRQAEDGVVKGPSPGAGRAGKKDGTERPPRRAAEAARPPRDEPPRDKEPADAGRLGPPPPNLWPNLDVTHARIRRGFLRLAAPNAVATRESYSGPVEVTVVARSEKGGLRLEAYRGAGLTFPADPDPHELRVDRPGGRGGATAAVEPLRPNTWYRLRWRVTRGGMELSVDGKTVFAEERPYGLAAGGPVRVKAVASAVDVQLLEVERLREETASEPGTKSGKAPVPDAAARAKAERAIREIFRGDYARHGRADRLALAARLLRQAAEPKEDAAARYVLCGEARDLAAGAGDAATAVRAIDALAREFDIDPLAMKARTLETAAVAPQPRAAALAAGALQLVEQAVDADRFDTADRLVGAAGHAARKAENRRLTRRVRAAAIEVDGLRKEHDRIQPFLARLRRDPDDRQANGEAGRYYCLTKGQWERGLPLLARGDDKDLKRLAERELARPADPVALASLADAWRERADETPAAARTELLLHAYHLYQRAAPGLAGLPRLRVDKALTDLETALLPKVALRLFAGRWDIRYASGNHRQYDISRFGEVTFAAEKVRGFLRRMTNPRFVLLDFGDDRLERIHLLAGRLHVEHFNPAKNYPNAPLTTGVGTR